MIVQHGVQAGRPQDVAPEHRHHDADEGEQTAKYVPDEVLLETKAGRRKVEVEGVELVELKLQGADRRGDEKEQEAPEDEEVHQTGVEFPSYEAPMTEDIQADRTEGALDTREPGTQVGRRLPQTPESDPSVYCPRDRSRGENQQGVDQRAQKRVPDVPELLTSRQS